MEITVYGYLLIPFLLILVFLKPKYLVYILILALTVQVTSLFNIPSLNNYSMQIYRFVTILLSLRLIIHIFCKGSIKLNREVKDILIYGGLFTFFTIVWSYLAPIIFAGYPVYPPELGIDYSTVNGPSHLHFSIYNIALGGYIILYFFTLVYISILTWTEKDIIIIRRIIIICLSMVILTSISQVFNYIFGTLDITKYFYTVTTRELNYSLIGNFLPIPRVQATYLEPSMLAPFVVGLYSYYLYRTFTKVSYINMFFTIFILLIIILSTSTTAYISLLIMTFLIVMYLSPMKISRCNIVIRKKNVMLSFTGIFLLCLIMIIAISLTIGLQNFIDLINIYVVNKPQTLSFINRTTADLHALNLFFSTYGLGVGLGSNRPSSLLPYLLSQLGIVGTFLFIIFMVKINIFCYKALRDTEYFGFFFLIPAVLINQLIAYPDITDPTLWQFIYIALIISLGVKKYENLS